MRRRANRLVILGILAVSLLLVVAGVALVLLPDRLPDQVLLQLRMGPESLPEQRSRSLLSRLLGGEEPTVLEVVRGLDAAASDPRVKGLTLRLSGVRCGLGRAQEVRQALARFRASGKPVVALMEKDGLLDYYVAAAADEVAMLPGGSLNFTGLVFAVPFARETLDRVGIHPDFERTGEEKDSPEPYTRRDMSEAMRRNLERLMDQFSGEMLGDVAADRGLAVADLESLLPEGFLTAAGAVEAGLVDHIIHADQVRARAVERLGAGDLEDLGLSDYLGHLRHGWFARPPRVAVVHASGPLILGESAENEWYGHLSGSDTLAGALRAAREDEGIEAVIVRVDSPGGWAAASEVVWREARHTAEAKPLVVSMGDYGASGGYYIAAAADEILADGSTITGSLGVFSGKFAMGGLYRWMGLNWELIKSGENADMFLDLEPWTDDQRRMVQAELAGIYERFLEVVAEGRGMEPDRVRELATGRIFSGNEAVEVGLADAVGGLHEALEAARRRAGLEPGAALRVEEFPRPAGWLAGLLGGGRVASPPPGAFTEALGEAARWQALAGQQPLAYEPARLRAP